VVPAGEAPGRCRGRPLKTPAVRFFARMRFSFPSYLDSVTDPSIASPETLQYVRRAFMNSPTAILCDGCGQPASPKHFAARLKRLECATQFRPVHINVLFLGAAAPGVEAEFLYAEVESTPSSSTGGFRGEGKQILLAAGLGPMLENNPHSRGEALAEFQHRGHFLTHVLECPLDEAGAEERVLAEQCARQLPVAMARLRRSLKPRRIVLFSPALDALIPEIARGELGAALLLDDGKAFSLDGGAPAAARLERLLLSSA
jgi:hypothetical protein